MLMHKEQKLYNSTKQGKAEFVKDVLSPLVYSANTGWFGANYEYDKTTSAEHVYLLNQHGIQCKQINVTGDSLEAMIRDVFRNL